jgi:FkbM family methyltransferase
MSNLDRLVARFTKRPERPAESDIEALRRLTPIAASKGEPSFLFRTADSGIGPSVYETSGFDEENLAWALDHLGQPQRRGTVVDVGGNIGTTTVSLLLNHGASRVVSLEAEQTNYRLLRCNLLLNGIEDKAVVRQLAVTDRDGQVTLEMAAANFGDHRIRVGGPDGALDEMTRQTVSVPARRLDAVLEDVGVDDVSLVWVDTQGHEGQVLSGARAQLGRGVPWVIEYWPYALKRENGFDTLHTIIAESFSMVVDVRRSIHTGAVASYPADAFERPVAATLPGASETDWESYTDLILIP